MAWLAAALEQARGKFMMAILGHPLYAGGTYHGRRRRRTFAALHALLREHDVAIVMAGDTHDLEYYAERTGAAAASAVHHLVNGGGGAYLSFGTALAWPADAGDGRLGVLSEPGRRSSARSTPTRRCWKRPVVVVDEALRGLAVLGRVALGRLRLNVAPFFQSFVEVRVEPSARASVLLP